MCQLFFSGVQRRPSWLIWRSNTGAGFTGRIFYFSLRVLIPNRKQKTCCSPWWTYGVIHFTADVLELSQGLTHLSFQKIFLYKGTILTYSSNEKNSFNMSFDFKNSDIIILRTRQLHSKSVFNLFLCNKTEKQKNISCKTSNLKNELNTFNVKMWAHCF